MKKLTGQENSQFHLLCEVLPIQIKPKNLTYILSYIGVGTTKIC